VISKEVLGRQLGDLLAFLLLPWTCLLLPRSWGESLMRACARNAWVLKARSVSACDAAIAHFDIGDRAPWEQTWRMLELVEARDMWFCLLGRGRSLLSRVTVAGPHPPRDRQTILILMHWGTNVMAMEWFRRAGLKPRLVYRYEPPELRRRVPFYWLYMKAMVFFIRRVCDGRAIGVPGGKSEIDNALSSGDNLVMAMDVPVLGNRRVIEVQFLGHRVRLHADGFDLVAGTDAPCQFFYMGFDDDTGSSKHMVFTSPILENDPARLAEVVGREFDQCVRSDSSQWRLWHASRQLFVAD
jgi:lauroyl/myristoyl acyltransferase